LITIGEVYKALNKPVMTQDEIDGIEGKREKERFYEGP